MTPTKAKKPVKTSIRKSVKVLTETLTRKEIQLLDKYKHYGTYKTYPLNAL